MNWTVIHNILVFFQHCVSTIGILIILLGVSIALGRYLYYFVTGKLIDENITLNAIRLSLGRTIILGLEFIVAADLIGTTTTPDYYEVGLLAIIVAIRTVLSLSLNRELQSLRPEE